MFGFSFGEITLIALVALFILGPERLPKVAHSIGRYWQRANVYLEKIRSEINQTIELDELKDLSKPVTHTDHTEAMNKALGLDTNPVEESAKITSVKKTPNEEKTNVSSQKSSPS